MAINELSVSVVMLLLRTILGTVLFAHGAQKVLGWFGGYGLQGTRGFFASTLHIPAPLFYMAAFTELFGGIALVLGLLTRLAALGGLITMLVATYKVHAQHGFFLGGRAKAGGGPGYEFTATLAVIALTLLIAGGGAYSLDSLLFR